MLLLQSTSMLQVSLLFCYSCLYVKTERYRSGHMVRFVTDVAMDIMPVAKCMSMALPVSL